ncbi:related to APA2 - ATP adenylyltransferase II [Ustilago sp. UG-2017a]|nr:related to APA2 - ATP adenylyltransferase II [Ustilago sp. UG-2017a]
MSITDSDLKSLSSEVKKQFTTAITESDAFFYPSQKVTLQESSKTGILWQIRTVPALLKKPKANDSTPPKEEAKQEGEAEQNRQDVFAPPYVPNLHVKDLALSNGHTRVCFSGFTPGARNVGFGVQDCSSPQGGSMGTELLAFYNCGVTSGASQPHRHLQFVQCPPLDTTTEEAEESGRLTKEEQEKITECEYKVPVEALLDRIERDGKEQDSVHALPLPWQHFVVLLQPPAAAKKEEADMERYIGNKFMGLLDALFRARMFAPEGEKEGRPSFNILITKRAMHLIPRSKEEFEGLPGKEGSEGKVGNLSINSLAYAGFMLTRSIEEQEALKGVQGGVEEVLRCTGVGPVEDVTLMGGLPTTNM